MNMAEVFESIWREKNFLKIVYIYYQCFYLKYWNNGSFLNSHEFFIANQKKQNINKRKCFSENSLFNFNQ